MFCSQYFQFIFSEETLSNLVEKEYSYYDKEFK
jgi:hypothetical protein